jgi:hypothetical protein
MIALLVGFLRLHGGTGTTPVVLVTSLGVVPHYDDGTRRGNVTTFMVDSRVFYDQQLKKSKSISPLG